MAVTATFTASQMLLCVLSHTAAFYVAECEEASGGVRLHYVTDLMKRYRLIFSVVTNISAKQNRGKMHSCIKLCKLCK